MRVAESLVIPGELERARVEEQLVIFAGAGVSMGPPANLPSFKELARQVAEPKVPFEDHYEDKLDRYLGRAQREGVNCQERARELLSDQGSHTPLHEHLLGIFGAPDRVQIITTNFDSHFAAAAERVYPGFSIPQYVGPALPPGKAFQGIVRLHGALDNSFHSLVLTDADFADAYMAEGWAARFLVRMFDDRTVLFVGYSISDPLMQYLLHALPPTGRWFALWHETEIPDQPEFPVISVPFKTGSDGNKYSELNNGLKRWHWYVSAAASEHERELRTLLKDGPPGSPLDADYVRERLLTDVGRQTFWRHAKGSGWFYWAVEEGFLDNLTDRADTNPGTAAWGQWCLTNHCDGNFPPLIRFLRGRPLTLQPMFLSALLGHLWRCEALPHNGVLRQLLALLINASNDALPDSHTWEWLMGRLLKAEYYTETLELLRAATRIRLQSIDRVFLNLEDAEGQPTEELPSLSNDVRTAATHAEVSDFLNKHGEALAAARAEDVLTLGEQRLLEAYALLDLSRPAVGNMDWLSFGRTSIQPSAQDRIPRAADVLIDMVRLVLDHWAKTDREELTSYGERRDSHPHRLFRRLALYAFSQAPVTQSQGIVARAIEQKWAGDLWIRPELYLVLKQHYPHVQEKMKAGFISALQDETWWPDWNEHTEHARFSLAQKLARENPQSAITVAFASTERKQHPEWLEGDPDGYLSRTTVGWSGEERSPIESATMVEWTPKDAVDNLLAELKRDGNEHLRYALRGALQQAVATNPHWGSEILPLLMTGDADSVKLANAIVWGLRESEASTSERLTVLQSVASSNWSQDLIGPLGSLVDKWAHSLGKRESVELLGALDGAADVLFDRSRTEEPSIQGHGWLDRAINHPAGHATSAWFRVATTRDWQGDQFLLTLDDDEKARWNRVIQDDTVAGECSRPVLGMWLERLSQGDFPWCTERIFPAFDPEEDTKKASQLWDGRLMQNSWSWTTLEGLQPYLDRFFQRSRELVPDRARQLGGWVSLLATSPATSGLTLVQLQTFIQHAALDAREAFAEAVPSQLGKLGAEERRDLWQAFLSKYWADRRTNMPLPLDPREVRAMIEWIPALPEVASEALSALRGSPGKGFQHAGSLLWHWKHDDSWVREHPTEAVGLVAFLVERRAIDHWLTKEAVSVIKSALASGAAKASVLATAELLVNEGSEEASMLIKQIRGDPS